MKITPREKRRHAAGREKNEFFLSPRRVSPFLAWGDFHARSTIPEEKWGTTGSLRTVSDNSLTWALYGSSASFRVRDRVKPTSNN